MTKLTLGSLFDGIGVFPLAASRYGILPIWASEIEKAPISITKRHFPNIHHLGDITKVNGGEIPPVHIITFGSPCQNLSNIGKREGLTGSQSSLFYHAIRIIEEMRCATVCVNFFSVVLFYQYFQHSIFVRFFWLPRLRLLACLLHKVRKARTLCHRQVNLKT